MIKALEDASYYEGFRQSIRATKEKIEHYLRLTGIDTQKWAPGDPHLADELRGLLHWCDVNLRLNEETTEPNLQVL
jgi:hypothetical protein